MGVAKNADLYEIEVAQWIDQNTPPQFSSHRPKVGTSFPDVIVARGDVEAWMEVKMSPTNAQMGSARVFFQDGRWQSNKPGPLPSKLIQGLNDHGTTFMDDLRAFSGRDDFDLVSARSKKAHYPNNIPYEMMKEFLATRPNKYIFNQPDVDLTDVVTGHYVSGKAVKTCYMSMGDHFYRLCEDNPLGVPDDVPFLNIKGYFGVSISPRNSKPWYEVMPRLKVTSFEPSEYSVNPGTSKTNPFT